LGGSKSKDDRGGPDPDKGKAAPLHERQYRMIGIDPDDDGGKERKYDGLEGEMINDEGNDECRYAVVGIDEDIPVETNRKEKEDIVLGSAPLECP